MLLAEYQQSYSGLVFFVLVAAVVFAILLFLAVRKHWTALAVIATLLIAALLFVRSEPVATRQTAITPNRQYTTDAMTTARADFPPVHQGVPEPDVHHSVDGAARSLARQWDIPRASQQANRESPIPIRVDGDVPSEAINAFISQLRDRFRQNRIDRASHAATRPSDEIWIRLDDDQPTRPGQDALRLTTLGPGNQQSNRVAFFVNKPWMEYPDDVFPGRPGQTLRVVTSVSRASTAHIAQIDARERIHQMYLGLVRSAIRPQHLRSFGPIDERWLDSQVRSELMRRGSFIQDDFSQRFTHGSVGYYRHSVLVDFSDRNINAIADQIMALAAERRNIGRQSILASILSIGVLTLMTWLLYLLVNHLTRGYFTWSLLLAAIVIGLAGSLLVLLALDFA